MKSKKLWSLVIAGVLGIVLIVQLSGYVSSASAAQSQVDQLEDAIRNEDSQKLVDLVDSSADNWDFTKKEADRLITFFQENPRKLDSLLSVLSERATKLEAADTEVSPVPGYSYGFFNLQEDGNKYVFFKDYQLLISPALLVVKAATGDSTITIDDEEIKPSEKNGEKLTYGPLGPGTYEVKNTTPSNVSAIKESKEVTLYQMEMEQEVIEFDFPLESVFMVAPYKETSLYINEEKTDVVLNDEDSTEVGPLRTDGKMTMHIEKEFPWGVVASEPMPIEEDKESFEEFSPLEEKTKAAMMEKANTVLKQRLTALQTFDSSEVKDDVTENYITELEKEISERKQEKDPLEGEPAFAYYDMTTIQKPSWNEGKGHYELKVNAEYHIKNTDDATSLYSNREDGLGIFTVVLTFVYDKAQDKWQLDNQNNEILLVPKKNEKKYEL
ncbi:hypothetical protein ACFFGV_20775 [Pontibacillus salicampi]|uniref:Uncharacterized protein n=1 Tax=Pontibacillus salicampi TaxID=1449801 RepID=A0ABV6LUD2_9BACI